MTRDHTFWRLRIDVRIRPGEPVVVTVQGVNGLYGELPAIDLFLEWREGVTEAAARRFGLEQVAEMCEALAAQARRQLEESRH